MQSYRSHEQVLKNIGGALAAGDQAICKVCRSAGPMIQIR
jgi:hypothetical protein